MMESMLEFKQIQMLQLEIAKEIKRICDTNDIDYFLCDGTLLGAVRHKGFIPWDDDMDIGMTTENYNKFLNVASNELKSKFYLQTFETDVLYGNVFAKVRLKNTTMNELIIKDIDMNKGIFVDIFCFDQVTDKIHRRLFRVYLEMMGKAIMLKRKYKLNLITTNKLSEFINIVLTYLPISYEGLYKKMNRKLNKIANEKGNFFVERDGMFKGDFIFPSSIFDGYVLLDFEGEKFKAPKKYVDYLHKAYGDYMELPPIREREKGHSLVSVELDFEFDKYFED